MNTPSTIGENELLPCPLCGDHLILTVSSAQAGIREPFYEHPNTGDCVLRVLTFLARPEQVAAWNRRSDLRGKASVGPVTREDAIAFLETACRNWSKVPNLSEQDIGDVAMELLKFSSLRVKSCLTSIGVEAGK